MKTLARKRPLIGDDRSSNGASMDKILSIKCPAQRTPLEAKKNPACTFFLQSNMYCAMLGRTTASCGFLRAALGASYGCNSGQGSL